MKVLIFLLYYLNVLLVCACVCGGGGRGGWGGGEHAREGLSEDEFLEKERGGRGKRGSFCDRDDQQGHSSSQPTPRKRKKRMKPTYGMLSLTTCLCETLIKSSPFYLYSP